MLGGRVRLRQLDVELAVAAPRKAVSEGLNGAASGIRTHDILNHNQAL